LENYYGSPNNDGFIELAQVFGLRQCVAKPTRSLGGSSSLLDLIFLRPPEFLSSIDIEDGISDHQVVKMVLDLPSPGPNLKISKTVYCYKNADISGLQNYLSAQLSLFLVESELGDINGLWDYFKKTLLSGRDDFVPMKNIVQSGRPVWFNGELRSAKLRCKKLYKKKKKGPEHRANYLKAFNEYTRLIDTTERDFIEALNPTPSRNKSLWSYIKSKNNKLVCPRSLVDSGGTAISDPIEKANLINNHYVSVFNVDPIDHLGSSDLLQRLPSVTVNSSIIFSIPKVVKLISNLKTSSFDGPDGICANFLKLAPSLIASFLVVIFRCSLASGKIPDDWRRAIVIPMFKGGDRGKPVNYRPISLTCIACKLMERFLVDYASEFFDRTNFLYSKQHGFRGGYSCDSQITSFYQDLVDSANQSLQVDAVLLDFSKAFDKVSHKMLLDKLSLIGLDPHFYFWVKDFLYSRSQQVFFDNVLSASQQVTSGVPQGSVLGPLLFLVFINDLPDGICSTVRLFADDCVIYAPISTFNDTSNLQEDIHRLCTWCSVWNMPLNTLKCNHITFSTKKQRHSTLYTFLDNTLVTKVDTCKYLGIIFDKNLKWNVHIGSVVSKASRSLYFVRRNFKYASRKTLILLYKSLIRPILEYGAAVWDPYHVTLINKLEMVQRRAARLVCNDFNRYSSVSSLLSDLDWDPLLKRRKLIRLCNFFKIYVECGGWNDFPIKPKKATFLGRHDHPNKVQIPKSIKDTHLNSFYCRTSRDWNSLPREVLTPFPSNVHSFRATATKALK
jgi:hypothetical protein